MSKIVIEAVATLSSTVNISTGLSHPNDMNKAKELFRILHQGGEMILKSDVVNEALARGWSASSAEELGSLAQQIGEGKNPRIDGGPWWAANIYEQITARA